MIVRLATPAMGTRFELVLSGRDEATLRAAGEEALEEIEEQDRRWSLFRAASLTARINRSAPRAIPLGADDEELFACALEVHRASRGAFDPTVAPLMRTRGFHDRSQLGEHDDTRVGGEGIELDRAAHTVRLADPRAAIDLGAIAKGHALDLAAERLREAGIESALLHGGTSTIVAIGAPPGSDGWAIGLAGDDAPELHLRDEALAVSASHGRTLADGAGHLLDPRTGKSAAPDLVAAVLAPSARLADAWSTALVVDGTLALLPSSLTGTLHRDGVWQRAGVEPTRFLSSGSKTLAGSKTIPLSPLST